jgi:GNAT superfamily N-acetyltransferase
MVIRQAKTEEAHILTGIAMRSKAYWGYDDKFMDACREALTVTADKITRHHVWLATEGPNFVGFYCLVADGETGALDDMFLNPPYIGKGCGRALWDHMTALARAIGVREFTIDADPFAEGFYLKMGAERIGAAESTAIPGRMLPLLRVKVTNEK